MLRATDAVQKVQAGASGIGASVVGVIKGMGTVFQAGVYATLPIPIRVLSHPHLADALSNATGGASRAVTDTVIELHQANAMVNQGIREVMTNPLGVARHAWDTFDANVRTNPLATPQDWFRGFKTATDVALILGWARTPVPVLSRSPAANAMVTYPMLTRGQTIDLMPHEYSVASGASSASSAQHAAGAVAAPRNRRQSGRAPLDPAEFKVAEIIARAPRVARIEPGADFVPLAADFLSESRVVERSSNPTQLSVLKDAATGVARISGEQFNITVDAAGRAKIVVSYRLGPSKITIDGMSWLLFTERVVQALNREKISVSEFEIQHRPQKKIETQNGPAWREYVSVQRRVLIPEGDKKKDRFRIDLTNAQGQIRTYEFDRRIMSNELVVGDDGRYMVFNEKVGLTIPNGTYHSMHFERADGRLTTVSRTQPTLDEIDTLVIDLLGPSLLGTLHFQSGNLVRSDIFDTYGTGVVARGPATHPQAELGGTYALDVGFFPNRSPELGEASTVDELLNAKEVLVPGRDGVRVDREISDQEIDRLSKRLGGVEVHAVQLDGVDYLLSGNFRSAPNNAQWESFARVYSMNHVHPPGDGLMASGVNGDLGTAQLLYAHTLNHFPHARLTRRTRVVSDEGGVVKSLSFGPVREFTAAPDYYNVKDLGLSGLANFVVGVRQRTNGVGVMRIVIPAKSSFKTGMGVNSDGHSIRQALLALAKQRGFETVTFEVDLRSANPATVYDLIVDLQGHRVVQSMEEARYNFQTGTYPTNHRIFVWHEDVNNPDRPVSNAEVWLDK